MDGWIDGWTAGRLDGWTDGWTMHVVRWNVAEERRGVEGVKRQDRDGWTAERMDGAMQCLCLCLPENRFVPSLAHGGGVPTTLVCFREQLVNDNQVSLLLVAFGLLATSQELC